jgi:hypothetical protein
MKLFLFSRLLFDNTELWLSHITHRSWISTQNQNRCGVYRSHSYTRHCLEKWVDAEIHANQLVCLTVEINEQYPIEWFFLQVFLGVKSSRWHRGTSSGKCLGTDTVQLVLVRRLILIVEKILVGDDIALTFLVFQVSWMCGKSQSRSRTAEWVLWSMVTTTESNQVWNMCFPSQYAQCQPCVGCSIR